MKSFPLKTNRKNKEHIYKDTQAQLSYCYATRLFFPFLFDYLSQVTRYNITLTFLCKAFWITLFSVHNWNGRTGWQAFSNEII